ncbi:paraquat-inducible protein A [Collimonas sp.]|jgi:paraquat-inducible protein A|uniref:paraquat-inducible protein A n=1 Tax=Collimonas sp. TaxID=1963772 RepID=UPI002C80A7FE|nr:paraquat-inducible protein A [Collimonas sp.]HWW06234.1 paraquat-inducible protein A [Collimonas sp.]
MTNHDIARDASASGAELQHLIACDYCDAVYQLQRADLAEGERAQCRRCGSTLYRESARVYHRLLPLVVTALILFLVSNAFPIVEMELKGIRTQTTLWGAVDALYADHMVLVALLVFATTILFPLAEMLMMLYLLVLMARHRLPAGFEHIMRAIQRTRPWGMIEVYLLGVVVTLVKLSSIADIVPGVALWSFSVLVVVLAAMLSFDPRELWHYVKREPPR